MVVQTSSRAHDQPLANLPRRGPIRGFPKKLLFKTRFSQNRCFRFFLPVAREILPQNFTLFQSRIVASAPKFMPIDSATEMEKEERKKERKKKEMEGQRRLKAGCSALRAPELGTPGPYQAQMRLEYAFLGRVTLYLCIL